MYRCAECEGLRDSHDGCVEAPSPPYHKFSLLCLDCEPDDETPVNLDRPFSKEQQAIIDRWEAEARDDDEP